VRETLSLFALITYHFSLTFATSQSLLTPRRHSHRPLPPPPPHSPCVVVQLLSPTTQPPRLVRLPAQSPAWPPTITARATPPSTSTKATACPPRSNASRRYPASLARTVLASLPIIITHTRRVWPHITVPKLTLSTSNDYCPSLRDRQLMRLMRAQMFLHFTLLTLVHLRLPHV
jgi:hypothetical protein